MKATATAILLAAYALAGVLAGSGNTECYNFFMQTDKCVHASGVPAERCGANVQHHDLEAVRLLSVQSGSTKRSEVPHLERRYDGPAKAAPWAKKVFSCPNVKAEHEVCIWAGSGPNSVGWLDRANYKNCGKQVYIQRQGQPNTVQYATISGGCDFGRMGPSSGCFQIGLNKALFDSLKPSKAELAKGQIDTVSWDFNNLQGNKPENAAF